VICDNGLAPKSITTPEYEGAANYAYHLDAGKFAPFLQKHCCEKLGVRHVLANVTKVNRADNGDIASIETDRRARSRATSSSIAPAFARCCSGDDGRGLSRLLRRAVLRHRAGGATALRDEDAPIPTHTISTAQSAGWIWDIGLPARRGTGHVYSSRHISEAEAERELRAYLGPAGADLPIRKIPIRSGHRETFWKGNCVAVGLAAGFLEPLEASAIVLIELSAKLIAEQMPMTRGVMDIVAKRFNETTHYRWGRIIDFLKLHYVLSKREDSAFWRDNRDPATIPERLQDLLHLWRYQGPWFHDEFDRLDEVFPAASYQYVLYGMDFRTEVDPAMLAADERMAERALRENRARIDGLSLRLPRHRELIRKIVDYGMQPV
jgi:tryptophan halogenase